MTSPVPRVPQPLAHAAFIGAFHAGRIAQSLPRLWARVSSAAAFRAGKIAGSLARVPSVGVLHVRRNTPDFVQSVARISFAGTTPDRSKPGIRAPARWGNALILSFVAVFGGWGYFVPLDGGAVAPGVVSPASGKKTIQHLEGGIVAELPVREGQEVKAGQPLVTLESTQARAAYETLVQQRLSLLARKARLDAEKAGHDRIELPQELRTTDPQIRTIVEAQQEVFDTRRTTHASRRDILAQRIEQLVRQIRGFEAQVESTSRQIELVSEELRAKEYLVGRGLSPKPEALRLKRTDAEISGKRGEYIAEIARARQQIGEAKMQMLEVDAERADQIAADAEKVRADLAEVNEKLRASADVVARTVVVAPVSGTVVEVKFKTIGGVVQRGEPIMSIVPLGEDLIIEARLAPVDVKAVHSGLEARIHLSAYSSRTVPKVPGTVLTVSADRLMDDATHQPYYLARVAVDRQTLHRLAPSVDLIPGMPVEVLFVTERRTMVEYLVKPFRDALWRSFRET
ncbi:MAG: HlyD family type I secretion periplasmic adaptor subunit [Proteobacteria bacterium]|nr:HlyD family type I secretion periplasmic adaptor subunit [Pseudomonadota bacterium]